jgi:D-glycero-alpha-D-manno-heptose 1-phosphate guanylyltransferase
MKRAVSPSEMTAAVLAGGLGTRLRSVVDDRPKVLAQVHARPFLMFLLDQLAAADFRSVVFCIGYLGEQIQRTFGETYKSLRILYSQEPKPLGTGGALRFALPQITSDPVLVLNGDSFCGIDLKSYVRWHGEHRAAASIVLTRVLRSERYGSVKLDQEARITNFSEKQQCIGPGWINAGIYMLDRQLLAGIPEEVNVSLEHEVFPRWTGRGLYGYYSPAHFLDIGTPEDFSNAEQFFQVGLPAIGKPALVLDRDGTIIEEREYLADSAGVKLIPGAGAALRELKKMGFSLVLITNQSGIARGFFSEAVLQEIHARLEQLLAEAGVRLDGIYICPHRPEDDCRCRKPKLGLMQQAASDLGFTLEHSIVIGDKASDVEMGRNAGAITFLVRTGYGAGVAAAQGSLADFVVDDLGAAARVIRHWAPTDGSSDHDHQ